MKKQKIQKIYKPKKGELAIIITRDNKWYSQVLFPEKRGGNSNEFTQFFISKLYRIALEKIGYKRIHLKNGNCNKYTFTK